MRYETILLEDDRLDRTHLRRQHESSLVEALRPGFTRISLNYFTSDAECRFVADAVLWVAEHGWKMLPVYLLNPETGEWRHRDRQVHAEKERERGGSERKKKKEARERKKREKRRITK